MERRRERPAQPTPAGEVRVRPGAGVTPAPGRTDSAEAVYAENIEPRSFACKRCGYTSTYRRAVEQHLRLEHPDLFTAAPAPTTAPTATETVPSSSPAAGRDVIFYTDAGTWENGTARQRSELAVWDSRIQAIVINEELPGTTNNEAEYAAIIAALELARHDGLNGLLLRSDSQLCVNQIKGQWQVKEDRLRPLRDRAARLLAGLGGRIEWVPRERNHAGIYLEKKKNSARR